MKTSRIAVAAFAAALACALAPCSAQEPDAKDQKEIDALKKRAEARYAELLRLKNAAKVGETDEGLVAVTKSEYEGDRTDPEDESSPTVGQVVGDENGDRKKLYAIIARGNDTDPAEVARTAMVGHFKRALPTHYVRVKGKWIQRKDLKLDEKKGGKKDKEKAEGAGETTEKKKDEVELDRSGRG